MKQFLLTLTFDGSAFHGWQVQPNALTVQEALQDAIERILGVRENVTGCSRTDSGVHADNFYCTVRTEKNISAQKLKTGLNALLPPEIAVKEVKKVPMEFHPRYDAKAKEYRYLIFNKDYKQPFYVNRALFYPWKLDAKFLNEQAKAYLGTHDFSAFCAAGSDKEDKTRTIYRADVIKNGDFIEFHVCGNGFLYNMVRIMVGTLLDIQKGTLEKDSIPAILESRDRKKAGQTAPPDGLYLHRVFYEADEAMLLEKQEGGE